MIKNVYRTLFLMFAIKMGCMSDITHAQNLVTTVQVLDAAQHGIVGIVILVNPGNYLDSKAFITNEQGEVVIQGLECEICTISAFDPSGVFMNKTTELSGSVSRFNLILRSIPLYDIVGRPAPWFELEIRDSKGVTLRDHAIVIRPELLTFENNKVFTKRTDLRGIVKSRFMPGDYTVGAVIDGLGLDVRFKIVSSKKQCTDISVTCVVAPKSSSHLVRRISIQLPKSGQEESSDWKGYTVF